MSVLGNLKPQRVFHYFEEIASIPHGSGNTKQISDYLVNFAKEHGLDYSQDQADNVIIRKAASAGYEQAPIVILQGHMDMVCEKTEDCDINFEKDGLRLRLNGDIIDADGTTLGGDDGIAVAYALAILDDDSLQHPQLEVLITSDEEIGLLGAVALDTSQLKGRTMINMDSEAEGIYLTSCAGGMTAKSILPVAYESAEGKQFELTISGLKGGHSGSEIHRELGNGALLLGRVIKALYMSLDVHLCSFEGGQKDNAIPRRAKAAFTCTADEGQLKELVGKLEATLQGEFSASDPELTLSLQPSQSVSGFQLDHTSMTRILQFMELIPNGVQHFSKDIEGLVETSLNAGIVKLRNNEFYVECSVRSSVESRKYELSDKIATLVGLLGGEFTVEGDYPAWEYVAESPIRNLFMEVHRDMRGVDAKCEAIHAGLECGIFSGSMPGLDCISLGPDMKDIHTSDESLSVASVARVYEEITEVLKRMK